MAPDNLQTRRRKGLLLFGAYAAILLFLLARIGHLQLARHDALVRLSDQNRLRPQIEQPTRGRIYDRNRNIIVDNRPSWTISLTPVAVAGEDTVIAEVARILEMDPETISDRLQRRKGHRYAPVPIQRDAPFDVVAQLRERGSDLPGVSIQMEPRRRYPFGTMASHVLGTLREIDESDLAERQGNGEDYLFGDLVGKEGLELEHERAMRGVRGVHYMEVDARGRTVGESLDREARRPVHGDGLLTTLDAEVQLAAESAFHDTARGAVVALDPRSGAVLALASIPSFDPLDFSGVLDAETWNRIITDERKPLLNRAVAGLYPPASTVKVLTALAGLQEFIIVPTTRFDPCVPGGWALGNREFQCWKDDHGRLTVLEALEESCDVFFYQVGTRVGLDPLHDLAERFGLSGSTGIELSNEMPGSFPDAAYYDARLGTGRWNERSVVVNLSIGQGEILSTPLQVAVMTASLANWGSRVTPYVAEAIQPFQAGAEPVALDHVDPEPIDGLDPEAFALVRDGMVRVVNGEKGTARYLAPRLPGIMVAGKTGTGQNPHGEDHAWFTCFAPVDDPEVVVTVVVENGGGGSAVAGPIAFQVLRAYFRSESSRAGRSVVGDGVSR
jgi:penicillin-binding protein 2